MSFTYAREDNLSAEDYISVLAETTLAPRRPLQNPARIAAMLRGANFIITARDEKGALAGLARCITDNEWICYCAELAVRESYQGLGVGREILRTAKEILGPGICLTLNADPEAVTFYEKIGMQPYQAFFVPRTVSD